MDGLCTGRQDMQPLPPWFVFQGTKNQIKTGLSKALPPMGDQGLIAGFIVGYIQYEPSPISLEFLKASHPLGLLNGSGYLLFQERKCFFQEVACPVGKGGVDALISRVTAVCSAVMIAAVAGMGSVV